MRRTIVLAAVAAALALPAAADAAGVVYWEGGNVFIATPDGAVKRQVTKDGVPETPDAPAGAGGLVGPYTQASADDAGNVVAARKYRAEDGQSTSPAWIHMRPDGSVLHSNLVSMASCGSGIGSIGPLMARVDASGRFIAFTYFCNYGPPSWSVDERIAINFPDMQTLPADDPPDWSGYGSASFFGARLIAVEGNGVWAQPAIAEAPLITEGFEGWIPNDGTAAFDIISFAVNRQGTQGVAVVDAGGEKGLLFYGLSGPIGLGGTATPLCVVETQPNPLELSYSPDGTQVAFNDDGGVKVVPAPTGAAADGSCLPAVAPTVIAPNGQGAAFTAYTPTAAAPGPGPGPGPSPGPGPGADPEQATLTVELPPRASARALAKGLPIAFTAGAAGEVTATGLVPRPLARRLGVTTAARKLVIARGSAQVAAGRATVNLRLVKQARGRAGRLRGKRLTVRLKLASAAGAATTSGTLRLR